MNQKEGFTVSIPDGKKYVLTKLHKPITREMTAAYLPEVKRLGEQLPVPAFLFDARGAPNARSTMEDHELYDFSKAFGFLGAKIAAIIDPDDRSYDFTDTVVKNAGYRHRLFTDEEEAIRWLEEP